MSSTSEPQHNNEPVAEQKSGQSTNVKSLSTNTTTTTNTGVHLAPGSPTSTNSDDTSVNIGDLSQTSSGVSGCSSDGGSLTPPNSPQSASSEMNATISSVLTDVFPIKAKFYQKLRKYLWIYPLLIAILVPFTCLTPYSLAVYYGHVNPIFPYVSDTGSTTPEAGFFSQFLDTVAILMAITTFIRYKQLKYYFQYKVPYTKHKISDNQLSRFKRYNFCCALIGYLSAFGVVIIGNFRATELIVGHLLGVVFAFNGTLVYMLFMNYMCVHLYRCKLESKPSSMFMISTIALIGLLGCMLFSLVSVLVLGFPEFFDSVFRLKWPKEVKGYWWHVLGTAFEWLTINMVSPYYLCMFRRIRKFADWDKVPF